MLLNILSNRDLVWIKHQSSLTRLFMTFVKLFLSRSLQLNKFCSFIVIIQRNFLIKFIFRKYNFNMLFLFSNFQFQFVSSLIMFQDKCYCSPVYFQIHLNNFTHLSCHLHGLMNKLIIINRQGYYMVVNTKLFNLF